MIEDAPRQNRLVVFATMLVFCVALMVSSAHAQTGGAGSAGAGGGGALGSTAGAPGTNSAGTAALGGSSRLGGPAATGTGNSAVDKQDRNVDRKIKSICRGC